MDNRDKNILIVDENDNITGIGKALKLHHRKYLSLHRAFSVFLLNSENKLLLQKRADCKLVLPGIWANTTCSHPFYNKLSFTDPLLDIKNHAILRLKYEMGLEGLSVNDLYFVGRILYSSESEKNKIKFIKGEPKPTEYIKYDEPENLKEQFLSENFEEWEVDYCLIVRSDNKCSPNPSEVKEVKYVSKEELYEMPKREKISPWLQAIMENVDIFNVLPKLETNLV